MLSPHEMLRSQFLRVSRKGYADNVSLEPPVGDADRLVGDEEHWAAKVATTDGREYLFTGLRAFERSDEGTKCLFSFADVVAGYWMTDQPIEEGLTRLKVERGDTFVVELSDGAKFTLSKLGHAVHPIMKFFAWYLRVHLGDSY